MKLKQVIYLFIIIKISTFVFLTSSCGNSSQESNEVGEKVEIDQSGVTMEFKHFDEDGYLVATIINKMDKRIDEFRAEISWIDANGEVITYANGSPIFYPIQQIERGIAPAGRKVEFTLMTNIERGPDQTESAEIMLKSVKFEDNSEWTVE